MSFAIAGTVAAVGAVGSSIYGAHQARKGAKDQAAATDRASELTQQQYEQTRSDLQPYTQAGTNSLAQLLQKMGSGGSLSQTYKGNGFSFNGSAAPYQSKPFNFEASPDYAFRKQQGMDGIQSSAAASGGLLSGATLKALSGFNSNLASGEFDNSYNRYLQGEQLKSGQHQQAFNNWQSLDNNAYSRFTADQNNQFSRLYDLVNMGQSSAAQVGNAGAAAAQQIGNNTMAGANAQAAGRMASANAISGGVNNLIGLGSLFI